MLIWPAQDLFQPIHVFKFLRRIHMEIHVKIDSLNYTPNECLSSGI